MACGAPVELATGTKDGKSPIQGLITGFHLLGFGRNRFREVWCKSTAVPPL